MSIRYLLASLCEVIPHCDDSQAGRKTTNEYVHGSNTDRGTGGP